MTITDAMLKRALDAWDSNWQNDERAEQTKRDMLAALIAAFGKEQA